jgi:hypothetical protein
MSFHLVSCTHSVRLAPCFIDKLEQGIKEYLNTLLTKYIIELNGVLTSYSNITILNDKCILTSESPFLFIKIRVKFTVFRPELNTLLVGIVNKVSPDHIGCLVYGLFNASIAADQFNLLWDNNQWNSNDSSGFHISPGSVIKFKVLNVRTCNDMLSIHGSLLDKYTGIVDCNSITLPPKESLLEGYSTESLVESPVDAIVESLVDTIVDTIVESPVDTTMSLVKSQVDTIVSLVKSPTTVSLVDTTVSKSSKKRKRK